MTGNETSAGGTGRLAILGDAFDKLPELDDNSAHAGVVDYPWEFASDDGTGYFGNSGTPNREFNAFATEDVEKVVGVLNELSRVLVPGSWVFVFADDECYPEFRDGDSDD